MSLVHLPDDVILEVLAHLERARDLARLARTCRRLHLLARHDGWRTFVRTRFSLLSVDDTDAPGGRWDTLADTLTARALAWEKRSFQPVAFLASNRRDNFFTGHPQTHPFSPVIDAALTFGGAYEVVAWGAGEAVIGRFRPVTGPRQDDGEKDAWFRLEGERNGFKPVTGDVTSIKLTEPGGRLGLLVGRASGDLQLVSAASGNAGQVISSFDLPPPPAGIKAASWGSVGYIDILQGQDTLVAGNRSTVCAFPMNTTSSDLKAGPVQPLGSHSFLDPEGRPRFIHTAKTLGNDTIACALGWDNRPLRWLTVTPTGFVPRTVPGDPLLDIPLVTKSMTTIRALEPVGSAFGPSRAGSDMVLTAWDDGTVRLFDQRAPSFSDAVFRDAFQPEEMASSLLTWGAHHFVAGSNNTSHLKVFDYRWPADVVTTYHPTDAAPCSGSAPFPPPQGDPVDRDFARSLAALPVRCDAITGARCVYHASSRTGPYRPNSCVLLQPFAQQPGQQQYGARPSRVHCLAKSSDAAASFYVGLLGSVAEMRIGGGDTARLRALEVAAAAKRGVRVQTAGYCFLETGHGRVEMEDGWPGLGVSSYMPSLVDMGQGDEWETAPDAAEAARHRWDRRFWRAEHFRPGRGERSGRRR